VFGKPVERRTLHSIRTLSIETGLHPKRSAAPLFRRRVADV
jgi:hypothetical protein